MINALSGNSLLAGVRRRDGWARRRPDRWPSRDPPPNQLAERRQQRSETRKSERRRD